MCPTSDPVVEKATGSVLNLTDLEAMNLADLRLYAQDAGLSSVSGLKKQDLTFRLLEAQAEREGNIFASGVLESVDEGYGFLRQNRFLPGPNDIYVSLTQIRRFGLRTGDEVAGQVRPPKENEKYFGLLRVEAVNGSDPEEASARPHFDDLSPAYPTEMFRLETSGESLTGRVVDLMAPIGKGQRGLIIGPPKSGKTTLLQQIARGIVANYPSAHLLVLLIGERPEEVTDIQRSVHGDVLFSAFDEPAERHVQIAEMALERARRLVEDGREVVVLLDSLTKLVRAYNLTASAGSHVVSEELDPYALYPAKRFFGAARNLEKSGSLTIVATCHACTGSRIDDLICEEFKGASNMEINLDAQLLEHRVFPAIDITRSGTRHEELLIDPWSLQSIWGMRHALTTVGTMEGTELLLSRLSAFPDNQTFLESLGKETANEVWR
jgi:transcription termination factor Rho